MKTLEPSIIDYTALRAEKARLGLYNEDIAMKADVGKTTVCAVLKGSENVNLSSIAAVAATLNLRPKVIFVAINAAEEQRGEVSGR